MPAGWPYFAWIDPSETAFGPEHMRWDEQVYSFKLQQEEGDPASLTAAVRRPRNLSGNPIGLLGPGRKIWCWFGFDCGPALIKFRGRLVGIPTSLFEDLVILEFIAKPIDVVAQKEALAETLRVLPYYDAAVIDESKRDDPEVVLEGYTKIWHYDRESHVITVSDELNGEDGLVEFDGASEGGKVFWDGLSLSLSNGPLASVDVTAEFTWTQQGYGTIDLTGYLMTHWPAPQGVIRSFTMTAADWPKTGSTIGEGWVAAFAHARDLFDLSVQTESGGSSLTVRWPDGQSHTTTVSHSFQYLASDAFTVGVTPAKPAQDKDDISVSYGKDGDGNQYVSSFSRNTTVNTAVIAMQAFKPTLVGGWQAQRQCTERVKFTLIADVQPILTDPEDGEALRIDNIRSINLSEDLDGEIPIGDARRRSYIATERGNRSVEHLIALARANLMKRARVVEITFAPKLSRMPEVTLRKNAFLVEPRVGEATGKIIGYSVELDGSDGRPKCEIRMGCTIGRGGTVTAADGTPTYCTEDYCGPDYQQYINRIVLFPLDTSVGYQPPNAEPNDDGLNLLTGFTAEEAIEVPLVVEFLWTEQEANINEALAQWNQTAGTQSQPGNPADNIEARDEHLTSVLLANETRAKFKLKSMTRAFTTDYEIMMTDLMIPTGYDLEAV